MIALAGTVGLILSVILMTKVAGSRKPLPLAAIVVLAVVEASLIFYYMSSLEVPVQ